MRNYNMIVKGCSHPNNATDTMHLVLQCPACGGIELIAYALGMHPVPNCQACCPPSQKRKE